jgi:hypothetical protein
VANDPGEVRNLAGDAGMAGELARLRKRLVEWMDAICDPMTNTWMRRQLLEGLKTQASPRPA